MPETKTLLAIGAHYDDCVFGVPGILLKAVRQHYRVVILTLIGDYTNWSRAEGREKEMVAGTIEISKRYGAEMRYLDFRSHLFDVNNDTKRKVAEAVADIEPDVALYLWPHDNHDDHMAASRLAHIALHAASPILEKRPVRGTKRMYHYDNGPRHTIGFVPDTFVDVSDEFETALDWLGEFMALVDGVPFDRTQRGPSQSTKEILAAYRGKTCGVRYAEALRALAAYPREIL